MKKYRILSLSLLLALALSLIPPAGAIPQEDLDLFCKNAVLLDATYDEVLYDQSAYEKAWPASTTKVMTALLVLDAIAAGELTPDQTITAGSERLKDIPSGAGYVVANLKEGEQMSVEDLLYCVLLPSHADAANVLAVAVDGTVEDFVAHMNRKAGELGCQNTHFTNTAGMHHEDHYSTAYDLALIFEAALEYDLFRTIIKTAAYTVPATNMSGERYFFNTNGLISNNWYAGYVYDKCIGGKTGNTDEAGRCLVAAAEDDDRLLISVVLGSGPMEVEGYADPRQGQLIESKRLLEHGFNDFERVTITRGDEPVAKVRVTMSRQSDEVMLKPQGSIVKTLPKGLDLDKLETRITKFAEEVEAPVREGQELGSMILEYEGEVFGELPLVAVTSVERSELLYKKEQFLSFFDSLWVKVALVAVAVLAVYILLKLFVFRRHRRYAGAGGRRTRGNYRGGRR